MSSPIERMKARIDYLAGVPHNKEFRDDLIALVAAATAGPVPPTEQSLATIQDSHQPAVPVGYVLAPIEPTPQMVGEGAKKLGALYGHHMTAQCYRAMLAAAQEWKP